MMDICPKCAFSAICSYVPSVDATELLQSGFSSLDVCQASIRDDISNLEQELHEIESLFIRIRDRRDKLLKDLGGCKALLAPIRRLPRETLLEIFSLASSDIPDPLDAPWSLGQVCSTWRSISRSCPSLWTGIHISESNSDCTTFLRKYISLSRDLPIHVSMTTIDQDEETISDVVTDLVLQAERWASLDLNMTGDELSGLLALTSSPAIKLTTLRIHLSGVFQPDINHVRFNTLFSSSPIKEAHFQRILYSSMPINMSEMLKFHVSYDPAELHSMLHRGQHLTELALTSAPPPRGFAANTPLLAYPHMRHTSLQRLSLVVNAENTRGVNNVPQTFDYVSLPTLQQFGIMVQEDQALFSVLAGGFEPVEYSRLLNLFRRSKCSLTVLTLSIPISVEDFLIPILSQSPALQKLDIFVNRTVARDTFKALDLEQGTVRHLKELCVKEAPIRMPQSGLLEEVHGLHALVLSRSYGDSRLETLLISLNSLWIFRQLAIPVAQDSPFRDLFMIKEKGLDVKFLLNGKDCLIDEAARVSFFG
ncbi:hypothetical protein F5146DRAFT_1055901 [Armillaria mellea]|nr:hypothetical protein F5146DRAFT_1055901 [Armillaria mellea]